MSSANHYSDLQRKSQPSSSTMGELIPRAQLQPSLQWRGYPHCPRLRSRKAATTLYSTAMGMEIKWT
jgi:hypothetical protein